MTGEELQQYPHLDWYWGMKPNKLKIPKVVFPIEDIDKWNEIHQFCIDSELLQVNPTPSGALPYNYTCKLNPRYMVVSTHTGFELVICYMKYGLYRFILGNGKKSEDNTVSGSDAVKEIYKTADEHGLLDVLKEYAVDKEEGLQEKNLINSPMVKVANPNYEGKEFDNVHHLDFNESYGSRICEYDPRLRPVFEDIHERRKENKSFYKFVETNSIGCFQSKYCVDINTQYKSSPYQLAKLARVAVNGTVDKILEMAAKLVFSGRKPLLYNTDGIWYQGDIYHDADEGYGLCQWKNDHKNCKLYIKSAGAYQYIEGGKVQTVLRGRSSLDLIKSRDDFEWREIDNNYSLRTYEYIRGKGVVEKWQNQK